MKQFVKLLAVLAAAILLFGCAKNGVNGSIVGTWLQKSSALNIYDKNGQSVSAKDFHTAIYEEMGIYASEEAINNVVQLNENMLSLGFMYEFRSNGTASISMGGKEMGTGTYGLDGNKLTMRIPGQAEVEYTVISLDSQEMKLTTSPFSGSITTDDETVRKLMNAYKKLGYSGHTVATFIRAK